MRKSSRRQGVSTNRRKCSCQPNLQSSPSLLAYPPVKPKTKNPQSQWRSGFKCHFWRRRRDSEILHLQFVQVILIGDAYKNAYFFTDFFLLQILSASYSAWLCCTNANVAFRRIEMSGAGCATKPFGVVRYSLKNDLQHKSKVQSYLIHFKDHVNSGAMPEPR